MMMILQKRTRYSKPLKREQTIFFPFYYFFIVFMDMVDGKALLWTLVPPIYDFYCLLYYGSQECVN